jgi:hypothetical protein
VNDAENDNYKAISPKLAHFAGNSQS